MRYGIPGYRTPPLLPGPRDRAHPGDGRHRRRGNNDASVGTRCHHRGDWRSRAFDAGLCGRSAARPDASCRSPTAMPRTASPALKFLEAFNKGHLQVDRGPRHLRRWRRHLHRRGFRGTTPRAHHPEHGPEKLRPETRRRTAYVAHDAAMAAARRRGQCDADLAVSASSEHDRSRTRSARCPARGRVDIRDRRYAGRGAAGPRTGRARALRMAECDDGRRPSGAPWKARSSRSRPT